MHRLQDAKLVVSERMHQPVSWMTRTTFPARIVDKYIRTINSVLSNETREYGREAVARESTIVLISTNVILMAPLLISKTATLMIVTSWIQ